MSAIGCDQTNSRRMVPMINLDPSILVQHQRKVTDNLPPLTVAAWKSSRTLYLDQTVRPMDLADLLSGDLLSMQDSEIASFGDRTDLEAFLQVNSHVKIKIPRFRAEEVNFGGLNLKWHRLSET